MFIGILLCDVTHDFHIVFWEVAPSSTHEISSHVVKKLLGATLVNRPTRFRIQESWTNIETLWRHKEK